MKCFHVTIFVSILLCVTSCNISLDKEKEGKKIFFTKDKIEQKGIIEYSLSEDSIIARTLLNIILYNPEAVSARDDSLIIEEHLVTMKYTLYWKFLKNIGWSLYDVDKNVGGAQNNYIYPKDANIIGEKLIINLNVVDNWEDTRIEAFYPMSFLVGNDTTIFSQPILMIDKSKAFFRNHSNFLDGLIMTSKNDSSLIEVLQENVSEDINVYFEHIRQS